MTSWSPRVDVALGGGQVLVAKQLGCDEDRESRGEATASVAKMRRKSCGGQSQRASVGSCQFGETRQGCGPVK